MTTKNILKISIFILVAGFFAFGTNSLAQAPCPANTEALSETSANLVGEVTSDGGDPNLTVWFQYGKTTAYGLETSRRSKYGVGSFCALVHNLTPCTLYNYRAVAQNSGGTSYGTNHTFTTKCASVSADIKANGLDGPITIPYNTAATLSWTSTNTTSCYASGAWSGTKATNGFESTGSLTSSKTYTITCTGPGGSASDSVTVNVSGQISTEFSVNKTGRNLSNGTAFSELIYADPTEVLTFAIVVKAGSTPLYNVIVKDTLPSGIIYRGDLKVDNILTPGDILTGLNIGNLAPGQEKTITFRADVAGPESFNFGQTQLTNTVLVSSGTISRSDTANVIVTKAAVAGVATVIPTGLTNNIFFDSFFLPLLITLLIIWLFKSRIIRFEEWLDLRKKEYQIYKSNKMLQFKIANIKTKERKFFSKRYRNEWNLAKE